MTTWRADGILGNEAGDAMFRFLRGIMLIEALIPVRAAANLI